MSEVARVPPGEDPYTRGGEVTTQATLPRPRLQVHTVYRRALGLVGQHPLLLGAALLSGAAGGLLGVLARSPVVRPVVAAAVGGVAVAVLLWAWTLAYRYVAVGYREVDPTLGAQARVALRQLPGVAAVVAVVGAAGAVPVALAAAAGGPLATWVVGLAAGLAAAGVVALAPAAVAVDGRDPRTALTDAFQHGRDAGVLVEGVLAAGTVAVLATAAAVAGVHGGGYAVGAAAAGLLATLGHLALGHAYVELEAL